MFSRNKDLHERFINSCIADPDKFDLERVSDEVTAMIEGVAIRHDMNPMQASAYAAFICLQQYAHIVEEVKKQCLKEGHGTPAGIQAIHDQCIEMLHDMTKNFFERRGF